LVVDAEAEDRVVLIIAGMHRSGTSLAASLLHRAGLSLGENLIGPDRGNPHGYFEDVEINRFHSSLLERLGQSFLSARPASSQILPREREEALRLISRSNGNRLWGFKDPRACLFLDLWLDLLPTARFVLVYRHPLEVVLSLWRRGRDYDMEALVDPSAALEGWRTHNEALLGFYRRHRRRASLSHIRAIVSDPVVWIKSVSLKLALPLDARRTRGVFKPDSLRALVIPTAIRNRFQRMAPEAVDLYEDLERHADLPLHRERAARKRRRRTGPLPGPSVNTALPLLLTELDPEASQASKRALDRIRTQNIANLTSLVESLETQVATAEECAEGIRRESLTLNERLRELEQCSSELRTTLALETARAERLEARLNELSRENVELERKLFEETARSSSLERGLDGKRSEIAAAKELVEGREQELEEARAREARLVDRVGRLEGALEERARLVGKLENHALRHLEDLTKRTVESEALRWRIRKQEEEIAKASEEKTQLRADAEAKEKALQDARARSQELETLVGQQELRLARLEAEAGTVQLHLRGKDDQVKAVQAHVGALEQLLVHQEAHSMRLELKLQSIESTRAWRWALKWYRFKRTLGLQAATEEPVEEQPFEEPAPMPVSANGANGANGRSKVLFISHDARRHGAQILLLHFLRWFKANTDIAFEIVLKGDGELRPEFEALGPVVVWNEKAVVKDMVRKLKLEPFAKRAVSSLRLAPVKEELRGRTRHRAIAENGELFRERFREAKIDLIYSNTGTNGKVLEALSSLNCPVICHVHELDYCLSYQTERDNTEQVRKHTNHYVAVSQAVRENLVRQLHVSEDQIDVVHEFIPTPSRIDAERPPDIRRRLGINEDALIVGASGTTDWRKGPDLFIQLAQSIQRRRLVAPLHFIWVGGDKEGPTFAALWHDVVHAGLERFVHFTGAVNNPLEHFALFDVFVLTSREDPFPLVNLEVASLAKPIVCFDGSGGAKEFVEDDCGFVVPYLNIEAMADRVVELLESPALRKRLGEAAAEKVRERHDVAKLAPRLLGIIERFRKNGAVRAVR